MRRLLNAVPIALIALPAAADFPPEIWFSPCGGPTATCVSPRIDHQANRPAVGNCASEPRPVETPSFACDESPRSLNERQVAEGLANASSPYFNAARDPAEPRRLQPIADDAHEMLARWEIASKALFPVTDAERLRLRMVNAGLTGQQCSLVEEFKQTVDAQSLAARYEWTTFSDNGDVVSLTAVPKDELERLFCRSFVVDLDSATGMPTGIRFGSPDSALDATVALRSWLDESANEIRLVGYETDISERRGVRTAELSDQTPRRIDAAESFIAPPAPRPFDCRESVEASKP